jgi:putative ABC transport system permease protein
MKLLNLAWRNILRNRRRSAFTLAAVAVAATAMLLLGGYVKATVRALETDTVRQVGHLQIMSKGSLQFGRGNTARFAMRDYEELAALLRADPALQALLVTITPVLQVQGVVGNYAVGASTNFAGSGWDPVARSLMMEWDGNGMRLPPGAVFIDKDQPSSGVIGAGLAQLLEMCETLAVKDCVVMPKAPVNTEAPLISADLSQLVQRSGAPEVGVAQARGNAVELMSSGAGGAPNVVRMEVLRAQRQGARELDAMYVGMPLELAQRLLFGPDGKGASALVLQLKHSADIAVALERIKAVLGPRGDALEVHDFHTIQPNFGTLRAIGFKRRDMRGVFLIEGALIGAIGAAIGTVLGVLLGEYGINLIDISWTPPGRSAPVPVAVDILGNPSLIATAIVLFATLACVSSWWPARRAAQLEIVEALRHV